MGSCCVRYNKNEESSDIISNTRIQKELRNKILL